MEHKRELRFAILLLNNLLTLAVKSCTWIIATWTKPGCQPEPKELSLNKKSIAAGQSKIGEEKKF